MFILEGALDIFWGDQQKAAQAGAFFFQPRGTPHVFRVAGKGHARILYMTCPAGFDRYVMDTVRLSWPLKQHHSMRTIK